MNKKYIIIIIAILFGIMILSNLVDSKYGDTIPTIVYTQNFDFNKEIYNASVSGKHVSITAAYPETVEKYVSMHPTVNAIENSISKNWKPYLKKDNEVIIQLKIQNNGEVSYLFLENTGIYSAADSARKAVLSSFNSDNTISIDSELNLIYKFSVE